MRSQLLALLLALSLAWTPVAVAQTPPVSPVPTPATDPAYPLFVGVGAMAAILVWNFAAYGFGALPGLAGAVAQGGSVPAYRALALSNFWTISVAVTGAWIADNIYMDW